MGKFRVPSWLQSSPAASTPADAETKKQNRRSLSNFISKNDTPSERAKSSVVVPQATPAPSSAESHIVALAKKISAETAKLEKYLKDNGLPDPGFDIDAPGDFPKLPEDIQKSRQEIVYATRELNDLVRGPRESVRWTVWNVSGSNTGEGAVTNCTQFLDTLSLQLINSYGIGELVHCPCWCRY